MGSKEIGRKMKVALMADVIDRKPERTLVGRRLAEFLLERDDVELTLVHYESQPDDPLYQKAKEILIKPVTFPFRSRLLSFVRFALTQKEQFDIFHWLVARPYPLFWLVPARKFVVTAFDAGSASTAKMWSFGQWMYNAVMRYLNRYMDAVVGGSTFGRAQIAHYYHVSQKKVHTIYCGVDSRYRPLSKQAIEPILKQYNIQPHTYFLYVGGMQPHKNVPTLVRAYSHYRNTYRDRKEKLVLVGNPSYGAADVKCAVSESLHTSDIMFIHYVSLGVLPAIYNGAIALVHPSKQEGFGLPPIEAMACGTPVISSNAASLPEVTGGAALLVDPDDMEKISTFMHHVAMDGKLRTDLSKRGLYRAAQFTWGKMGQQYVELYKATLLDEKAN